MARKRRYKRQETLADLERVLARAEADVASIEGFLEEMRRTPNHDHAVAAAERLVAARRNMRDNLQRRAMRRCVGADHQETQQPQ